MHCLRQRLAEQPNRSYRHAVNLLIRPANPLDAEPICSVFLAARQAAMPWLPTLHTPAEARWWIRTTLLPMNKVWIAEQDGQVVAFVGLRDDLIEPLYVHPTVWSQGIGTRLLRTVQAEPPDRLGLSVFQRNTQARRFCERRGFRLIVLGTGSANDEGEPDAYYEWYRPASAVAVL